VVVAGSFDRLEIWTPTRYEQVTAAGTESMAGGA
jgi:DNA-binding transcriptional regulator/RsmH inhibitor MraZ